MNPLIAALRAIAPLRVCNANRLRSVHAAAGIAPTPSNAGYRLAR